MKTTSASKRQPVGFEQVAQALRDDLVRQPWQADQPLPTHTELCRRFHTTKLTVQRAMNRLAAQGFVVGRRPVGSFTADRPPHRFQYGLVFPGHPGEITSWQWTRHFLADYVAAEMLTRTGPQRVVPYFDVTPGSAGYRRLLRDVADHSLAGLIFAYSPAPAVWKAVRATRPLPMAFPGGIDDHPALPVIIHDTATFLVRAVALLRDRGCSRVAILTDPRESPTPITEYLARQRLTSPAAWIQAVEPYHHEWLAHSLKSILTSHPSLVPDGLIITDDHLVEPTAAGLEQMSAQVPANLVVVGHWNFPLAYHGALPVQLLGFNAVEVLRLNLQRLTELRDGQLHEMVTWVPVRSQQELDAARGARPASRATFQETLNRVQTRVAEFAMQKP